MNPSAHQYSRIEPEESLQLEELQEVGGGASSCRPRALLALTLLCCLLLSSNVVLLNLYIKQSRITEEALQNQTKLWKYETSLSSNNTALGDENEELSQRNMELQNKTLVLLGSETTLHTQNKNLTQQLNACGTENDALSAVNANLTADNRALRGELEVLANLSHRLQGRIANLSHSEDKLLETNADLASTDSKLLQWVKDLEVKGTNLTLEVAKKSAEEHDLSLQYATLEKHCHAILPSLRDHHHRHNPQLTSSSDLTGKSIRFPPGSNDRVTFQPERVEALSSFTICLRHSTKLYWDVFLGPLDSHGNTAKFQLHPQRCVVSINGESQTIQVPHLSRESTGWSHTCLTWRADSATARLWFDGVSGQEHRTHLWGVEQPVGPIELQYYEGSGIVTDLHVWDHALSHCEIGALSAGLGVTSGNVLNWANILRWEPGETQLTPQEGMCRSSY
ncbi:hypothetical protein GN956_G1718 [Arapaima gigas]